MIYNQIYKNLITNGYHIGKFEEFFNDLTGIKEDMFLHWTNHFRQTAGEKQKRYCYRHNFIAQNSPHNYLNSNQYSGPVPTDEEFLQEIPYARADNRKQFVNQVIAGGGDIRTTQQWSRLKLENFEGVEAQKIRDMDAYFGRVIRKHTSLIYPELFDKKNTFKVATGYSLYETGDFSEVHYDGINPGRACVIILYLADPLTYHNDDGGKLLIIDNHNTSDTFLETYEQCVPVYGNYAIMDFTKFNMGHSIELVKNKFKRFAIQSFIGP